MILPVAVALLVGAAGAARADGDGDGDRDGAGEVCAGAEARIVVDSVARTLPLCERGAAVARHAVALGRGGVGKTREGDGKTPLGTYPLGAPRASRAYDTFIPVGYPTAAERARGLTGSAIGVHGPDRRLRALGRLATAVGWTRGCIAVGSDAEIRAVAAWVRRQRGALSIEIR